MSFWGELKRRDVFKVAVAYLVASWLIVQVVGVLTEPLNLPDELDTVVVVLLAIGFPFALIIAWVYEVAPDGIRVTSSDRGNEASAPSRRLTYVIVGVFVLAVGLMVVNRFLLQPSSTDFGAGSRLAILPCTDLSPDPSNAFFALGIHQELIRQLGSLRELDVIAGSAVQQYAGRPTPAPQVADELQVQAVMECSALYSGDQVRLTMLLVDGASATSLWSSVYPGDMSNLSEIFDIQADIAMQVANALHLEFLVDEIERIERISTNSREAYERYLEAIGLSAATGDFGRIEELMDQAIALDPEFAEAWSVKSRSLSTGFIAVTEDAGAARLAEAMDAAERAISLAPNQGHGYAARAQVLAIQGSWLDAEQDWRTAMQLGDTSFENVILLLSAGYADRARAMLELTLETDPRNANLHYFLLLSHEMLGDSEAANAAYQRGRRLFPNAFILGDAAWIWIRLGRGEVGPGYDPITFGGPLARLPEFIGDPEGGLALLNRVTSAPENQFPALLVSAAVWSAYFGDAEYALQLLDAAVSETGSGLLMFMAWLPVFEEMRQLPGFRDFLRRIGLVEYWQTQGWPDICSPLGDEDFVCS